MAKKLVVVESPTKAKTLERYLGQGYTVKASYGHIRDLPKNKLGVDTEGEFEPEYVVPEASRKHVASLKAAHSKADGLILATDFDREGEAIAYHVATLLGVEPSRADRVTFTEITRPSRPDGSSTASLATASRRSCGRRSGPGCRPGGCSRWPSG